MGKIDTSKWGQFYVEDLFFLTRGSVKNLQLLKEGTTPVIAAAGFKQGIAGYYDVVGPYSNCITVSCNGAGCGSTFYHPYSFNINGDAMVLEEKIPMTDMAKQYIACILNGILTRKYSYAEKCSPKKAGKEKIKLPMAQNGKPDFQHMESYMDSVKGRVEDSLKELLTLFQV